MSRVKRGPKRRQRLKKVFDRTEGFVLGRKNKYTRAVEAVRRAGVQEYRDRRTKKREFRQLWIARLSAAASDNQVSYSRLISGLKKSKIELDRKVLSDIAITDPSAFSAIVEKARPQLPQH